MISKRVHSYRKKQAFPRCTACRVSRGKRPAEPRVAGLTEVMGQMVEHLLRKLPYSYEYILNLKSESCSELHIKNPEDHEEIITELLRHKLTKENLKRLEGSGPPHREFRAPCTVQSFHNPWSNLLRCLGRRIHGSVEDTKLSTNKQHSLSPGPGDLLVTSLCRHCLAILT
jgi:hypothetical protein